MLVERFVLFDVLMAATLSQIPDEAFWHQWQCYIDTSFSLNNRPLYKKKVLISNRIFLLTTLLPNQVTILGTANNFFFIIIILLALWVYFGRLTFQKSRSHFLNQF